MRRGLAAACLLLSLTPGAMARHQHRGRGKRHHGGAVRLLPAVTILVAGVLPAAAEHSAVQRAAALRLRRAWLVAAKRKRLALELRGYVQRAGCGGERHAGFDAGQAVDLSRVVVTRDVQWTGAAGVFRVGETSADIDCDTRAVQRSDVGRSTGSGRHRQCLPQGQPKVAAGFGGGNLRRWRKSAAQRGPCVFRSAVERQELLGGRAA